MCEPWVDYLSQEAYPSKMALVAIDECHLIIEWGKVFRPKYRELAAIQSLATCPWGLFTATTTNDQLKHIVEAVNMKMTDVEVISAVPDRYNMYSQQFRPICK